MRKRKAAKPAANPRICLIENCGEPATVGKLCKACYSGLYYWQKKTPTAVMERIGKLARLRSRMNALKGTGGKE